MIFFIYLAMLFCHIVDDFYLQGILAKMKQKSFWKEYGSLYKFDHIAALIIHSFSWSFMIMLPIAISLKFNLQWFYLAYPINAIIHATVDHLKANKLKINLLIDQLCHFTQIHFTFVAYCIFFLNLVDNITI